MNMKMELNENEISGVSKSHKNSDGWARPQAETSRAGVSPSTLYKPPLYLSEAMVGGATEAESEFPAAQLRCCDGCAHGQLYMIYGILLHLDSWTTRLCAAQALVHTSEWRYGQTDTINSTKQNS